MPEEIRVAAVVPTLNEEEALTECLRRLRELGADELIVVDGGSADASPSIAAAFADRTLSCAGGLFAQLNLGASVARADAILFQYADGDLPDGAVETVRRCLRQPGILGGVFRLGFSEAGLFWRVVAAGARFRNGVLRFGPFGDQSIFILRREFEGLGGFVESHPHADHLLCRELRRRGALCQLDGVVRSSTRRWNRCGRWRTLARHWRVTIAHVATRGRVDERLTTEVRRLREVR